MNTMHRAALSALLASTAFGLMAGVATAAMAQEAVGETVGLEEIVVTARKREERLQDTPLAVTAFTASDFENRSSVDVADVGNFAPNVTFDATAPISGSSNAVSVFIRGIGQTDFLITTDPGVGIYLDGVYIARSTGGLLDLVDVERVEVLRGPQGTLFGKNTIGGAISLTTKRPNLNDMEAQGQVTFGRFSRLDFKVMANLPLGDTAAVRASFSRNERDGYGRRLLTNQRLGGLDNWTARVAGRWQPTPELDINVAFDYTKGDEESPVSTIVSGSRQNSIGGPGTLFAGLLYNNLIRNPATGLAPCATPGFPIPFCGVPGLIQTPQLPSTATPYDRRWITGDLYTSNATGPTGSKYDIYGISGTIEWDLDAVQVKSITAYRNSAADFARDPDGSPLVLVHTSNTVRQDQFSQELQLTGQAFEDRFNWVVGGFFMTEQANDVVTVPFAQGAFDLMNATGQGCSLLPALTGAPGPVALPFCPNIFRVDNLGKGTLVDNKTYAIFGEGSYDISEKLSLTGGLRWTRDEKKIDLANILTGGAPFSTATPRKEESFNEVNGRVILDYKVTDGVMTYASFSTGFKSGGFNGRYGAPIPAGATTFEPEKVKSYEVGLKGDFLDRRLRINTALFLMDYSNIQVVVFDNGIPRTINAAGGEVQGLEVELTAAPVRNLLLQVNYGYLDARYTKLEDSVIGSFGLPIVNPLRKDYKFVNAPDHNLNLGVQYTAPIMEWGELMLRGDVSHRSSVANDAVNTPELIQKGVTLVNLRATLSPLDSWWSVSVFGTNVTNERYFTSGVADEPGFGLVELNAARPSEWGVTLSVKY
jgi:iron complex outermembrane recepter protein